jgi:hypothetical protein
VKEQPIDDHPHLARTEIDQTRAHEYRDFAHSKSLPIFRAQPGFAGVLFAAHATERAVITLWHELACVEALEHSPSYQTTVADIEATGFLDGESAVEVLDLEEVCRWYGWLRITRSCRICRRPRSFTVMARSSGVASRGLIPTLVSQPCLAARSMGVGV